MSGTRPVPIAAPTIGVAEWEATREVFESGWVTQGPQVAAFETDFAARHGVPHAVATTSCTTALHLVLAAIGVGPGDEVIVPSFTWVATSNVVRHLGAEPVFVDVDPTTYNITPEAAAAAVTPRTRAVIPVHLFGLCADMDALAAAVPDGTALIEDAACAVGATYHGRPAGGLGDAAAFSFHPRKIITTGEGGMLTTRDEELAEHCSRLRNHGASVSEEIRHAGPAPYLLPGFEEVGFNYRMTDIQGAVGRVQLGRLDGLLERRRAIAAALTAAVEAISWLDAPEAPDGYGHGWQAYVCRMAEDHPRRGDRNDVMMRLLELGVDTRPGTHAPPLLGAYGQVADEFPVAALLEAETIALPLHNQMSDADVERVVDALRAV